MRRRSAGAARSSLPAGKSTHGSRVVPGKAPRDSFLPPGEGAFSALGRLILDRLDRGVILLDEAGAVLDANQPAIRILQLGDAILVRNGRLVFADAAFDQRVTAMTVARRATPEAVTRSIASRCRRSNGQSYLVVVYPVPPAADGRKTALAVFVFAPDERRDVSTDVLRELYGLTRAQSEVARQLFAGRSVEQAARALDVSPNTVRTHLKHIFTKCDVQSQAELMHLLAQGPSAL